MKKLESKLSLFLVFTLVFGLAAFSNTPASASVILDQALVQQLNTAAPDATVQAILTYNSYPTTGDVAAVRGPVPRSSSSTSCPC